MACPRRVVVLGHPRVDRNLFSVSVCGCDGCPAAAEAGQRRSRTQDQGSVARSVLGMLAVVCHLRVEPLM